VIKKFVNIDKPGIILVDFFIDFVELYQKEEEISNDDI